MAYTITTTDGTNLGTIADGTINTTATSLTLIGRNYSNYGQLMTDNLVALLENFANTIEPSNPLEGQLYWNTTDKRLRIYNGTNFKIIAKLQSSAAAPNTTTAGDMWWDSVEEQLYVYNGSDPYAATGWILISPLYKKSKGKSGAIPEQIIDSGSVTRDVISLYLNGTRTAIISSVSFAPLVAITGFGTINAGLTANSTINSGQYFVTADDANKLGGVLPAAYLRSDEDDTTSGTLGIINNGGLTIGLNSNVSIETTASGNVEIASTRAAGEIIISATRTGQITPEEVLKASANAGEGITASKKITITDATAASSATTGALVVAGGAGITANLYVDGEIIASQLVGNVTGTSDMVRSVVPISLGGTSATTVLGAQTAFSLVPGTHVQPQNAELTAITLVGANGLLTRTSTGNATARTIVSADSNIVVDDGDGVAGNPTITLDVDAALGSPTATTQADGDSSTKVATTAFVKNVLPTANSNYWYSGSPAAGQATYAGAPYGTILIVQYTQSYQVGTGNGGVYTAYRTVSGRYIKVSAGNSWRSF